MTRMPAGHRLSAGRGCSIEASISFSAAGALSQYSLDIFSVEYVKAQRRVDWLQDAVRFELMNAPPRDAEEHRDLRSVHQAINGNGHDQKS
jgi:hypothetical protein